MNFNFFSNHNLLTINHSIFSFKHIKILFRLKLVFLFHIFEFMVIVTCQLGNGVFMTYHLVSVTKIQLGSAISPYNFSWKRIANFNLHVKINENFAKEQNEKTEEIMYQKREIWRENHSNKPVSIRIQLLRSFTISILGLYIFRSVIWLAKLIFYIIGVFHKDVLWKFFFSRLLSM